MSYIIIINSNINKSNGFFGGKKLYYALCMVYYFGQFPAQPTVRYEVHCWTRMVRTSWTKKVLLFLSTSNFDLQNGYYNMSLCRSSSGLQIICCVTCSVVGWPFPESDCKVTLHVLGNSAMTLAQHLSVTGTGPVKT